MLRTGVPVDVWADQGWRVIDTALELLEEAHDTAERGQRSTWAQG